MEEGYHLSKSLIKSIKDAEKEKKSGKLKFYSNADEIMKDLSNKISLK